MNRLKPERSHEMSGFTLVEIMVALGLISLASVGVMSVISNQNKVKSHTQTMSERLAIRKAISNKIECGLSRDAKIGAAASYKFDPADCGSFTKGQGAAAQLSSAKGKYFKLKDSDGNDIAIYNGYEQSGRIGRWLIRASCSSDYVTLPNAKKVSSLVLFAAPTTDEGQLLRNPMTQENYEWDELFPEGLCATLTTPPLDCLASGGKIVNGYCYFIGGENQSCDSVCGSKGARFDSAGTTYLTASGGGGSAACVSVMGQLGIPTGKYAGGSPQHKKYETSAFYGFYSPFAGCKYFRGVFGIGKGIWTLNTANSGSSGGRWPYARRACACSP